MKKWFHRSLKNQLIAFILIVVLIPIIILGLISYYSTVQLSKDRAEISGESFLEQIQDSISFIINDVENMSVFLIGNQAVQEYLQVEGDPIYPQREIYGFLSNLAFSKQYIDDIIIYPSNGNSPISTNLVMDTEEMGIFDRIPSNKWWSYRKENETVDGRQERISLTRPIRSTSDFEQIGYLTINLNVKVIEAYLNAGELEWDGSVFILNNGKLLSGNQTVSQQVDSSELQQIIDQTKQDRFTYELGAEKFTIFTKEIETVGWDLVSVIPFQEYSSQNKYILWLTVYSVILAGVLITALVIFFISKILRPLIKLTDTIRTANPGDKLSAVDSFSYNEIGDLISSYNQLNERISVLMRQVQKNEAIKRQADLQALQSQINPHFLYNTLASVHWIALQSQAYDISRVVSSLSTFLQFSLNKGNEYCTIEQEVGHVRHYVDIKEIRFPDTFSLQLDIPEEIKQDCILKLILQPLVENSIKHGFFSLQQHYGRIKITAEKKDNRIHFAVMDNGAGMSEAKRKELQSQFLEDPLSSGVIGTNYGLRNVNLRLCLHFGQASGLRIFSEKLDGTTIQFSIPRKGR
ncbi:cache domain-containing sensor histidine kinase [Virgibacillus salexigens]|uniref:histidine kinase n=1 Tax=Virgibacillus kapii TaxID=1638645 RepID=A0ABQ2DJW6_9BACI|nr:sensor histidine kinase [Virgibacillus kapii]GGJ60725.1 histidine kinase [Virgibacillus kapii]